MIYPDVQFIILQRIGTFWLLLLDLLFGLQKIGIDEIEDERYLKWVYIIYLPKLIQNLDQNIKNSKKI